jgi:hypothetical protein
MKKLGLIVLLVLAICIVSDRAIAQCDCAAQFKSAEAYLNKADVVFLGKIISTKNVAGRTPNESNLEISFEVQKVWKNHLVKVVTVFVQRDIADFEKDAVWLVYAFKLKNGGFEMQRHCCSRTQPISRAQDDIRAIERMAAQKRKILN